MPEQRSRIGRDFCVSDFDPQLRKTIAELAQTERRSVSQQIQILLDEALKMRGANLAPVGTRSASRIS